MQSSSNLFSLLKKLIIHFSCLKNVRIRARLVELLAFTNIRSLLKLVKLSINPVKLILILFKMLPLFGKIVRNFCGTRLAKNRRTNPEKKTRVKI